MPNKKRSPKKQGLNKQELKKIRESLVQEKARILEEIMRLKKDSLSGSMKEASGDLSGYSFHMADMATDLYDREFLLGLAESERKMLYDLDMAIKRIDEGTYGKCDMCSEPISKERLKAMPEAQYCIKCQEEKEKSIGR